MAVLPSILVVDDEPAVLLTYTMILRQNGYDVTGASSVANATQALAERRYDLLVCDLALESSRGGFQVVDFARTLYPHIPAVLLTGFASREASDEANQKDVVVMFKPLDVRDLLATVARLISGEDLPRAQNE